MCYRGGMAWSDVGVYVREEVWPQVWLPAWGREHLWIQLCHNLLHEFLHALRLSGKKKKKVIHMFATHIKEQLNTCYSLNTLPSNVQKYSCLHQIRNGLKCDSKCRFCLTWKAVQCTVTPVTKVTKHSFIQSNQQWMSRSGIIIKSYQAVFKFSKSSPSVSSLSMLRMPITIVQWHKWHQIPMSKLKWCIKH